MKGSLLIKVLGSLGVLMLLILACAPKPAVPVAPKVEVPMGSLNDCTGPTSDVGKDMFLGMQEAVAYWNDQGGINGKPIKLYQYDYGYRVPEAITTYKRFRDYDKVVAVWGWGTGDTEALAPTINIDKICYLSCSFSGHLCNPIDVDTPLGKKKGWPYNFVYGSDYSTNARAALTYWYENYWLKDPRYEADRKAGVKPRLAIFGAAAIPYATAPLAALRDQARLLGVHQIPKLEDIYKVTVDQDVSLTALDTKSQVLAIKEYDPHIVWHGNTTMSVATTLKDFYALGLSGPGKKTMHIINNWGFDENLPKLAGPAAEGTIGLAASPYIMEDYPFKPTVLEYAKKLHPGTKLEDRLVRTTQAYIKVKIFVEALKALDKAGKLDLSPAGLPATRAALKEFMETTHDVSEFSVPGIKWPPRVYTSTDHRPTPIVVIAEIRGGKPVTVGAIDMKAWAEKTEPGLWLKWLGW